MGRANISEVGKRFTSEYQPARRGRPKGSPNHRTILRAWLEAQEPPETEGMIQAILNHVFGRKARLKPRRRS